MKSFGLWLMVLICLSCSENLKDFKTVGYLPTSKFETIDRISLEKITHLNIAFAEPDSLGQLETNGVSLNPIVQKAHTAGVEVYISLAGASSPLDIWARWIDPQNRAAFISDMIDFAKKNQLQGIDVDLEWETINEDYSGFVLELKDSLVAHKLGMTAALPGTYRYPEITDEALASFDWINLMAYDLTGFWNPEKPGPHSPYSFAEQSIEYWEEQGLSKNKMTLGLPFYGYDFTDLNKIPSVTYGEMVEKDSSYAFQDAVGEIHYNGITTIEQKTRLAMRSLSGIMIWEIGQDHFGKYSLLDRIYQVIQK